MEAAEDCAILTAFELSARLIPTHRIDGDEKLTYTMVRTGVGRYSTCISWNYNPHGRRLLWTTYLTEQLLRR